ncbi:MULTISPECIES: hypothetical protein [unclassified Iodidimonas]|jgi:hypothetical protein|uniref:hypothetical protein n=1 Tax=unclassified Iodidimonas TaxID=2626145 RepID=UPI0024823108|nr:MULTISPECIES: hypothetical protein [unclassified Iodidimonas]
MTPHPKRKSLRERVAARKAGLPEYEGVAEPKPWRRWLRYSGMVMQIIAFVLLVIEVFRMIETDFFGIDQSRIIIYLVVFFTGRVLQMIAGFSRH